MTIPTDHLWPGCVAEWETEPATEGELAKRSPRRMFIMKMTSSDPDSRQIEIVTRLKLTHPDSPIAVEYYYHPDDSQSDIMLSGLRSVSNRDVREVLPVLTRLRNLFGKGNTQAAYDQAFMRIEEGDDPAKVKAEFLAASGVSSAAYDQAMYRRRKEKDTNE